eukprot:6178001-Pleurochrysis_carterae.AAC.2
MHALAGRMTSSLVVGLLRVLLIVDLFTTSVACTLLSASAFTAASDTPSSTPFPPAVDFSHVCALFFSGLGVEARRRALGAGGRQDERALHAYPQLPQPFGAVLAYLPCCAACT